MLWRAINPGRGRKGGEAKLLCRPLAGATSRVVGVLRREWQRATARKPTVHACEARTGGPDDDDDPIDEMWVW